MKMMNIKKPMKPISFWHRLLDLISPRLCVVCDSRLSAGEEVVCAKCHFHLPRTDFHHDPHDNEMARHFWHQIPVERATAFFYYEAHAATARILYAMKYGGHPEIGEAMGRMMATEIQSSGFFEGIDVIIPVPLTVKRQRQRGYNQSMEIARGISAVTGIPVDNEVMSRIVFAESQTHKDRWARNDNVIGVFRCNAPTTVSGRHVLLIDDVVTTGATLISCAQELMKASDIRLSILTLGYAKS